MNNTSIPITTATGASSPEFADHHGARALFGLSRVSLYRLAKDGRIKSVCLRQRGRLRGRRLFDCDSIRQLLREQMEEGAE
jgi:hypothetical protein